MDSETKYPFYAWTKVELDPFVYPFYKTEGGMTFRKSKIVGTPELIANISLGYEIGGFSGRISSYYQGATLTQAKPSNLTTDVAQSKLLRFDMQLSQKIKKVKGLSFYLNINNLTNNPDRRVLRFYQDRIVSEERYGVSGDLGVRYQF
jgi:outer membrane receptor protein involved in Fe transport